VTLAWLQDEAGSDEAEPLSSWTRSDRLCLALGLRLGLAVATADVGWEAAVSAPELIILRR
jgi:PIN domain nuclease of toxin-antitoxin system